MGRLWTAGAETRHAFTEGISLNGSTAPTFDTLVKRTGAAAFRCVQSAVNTKSYIQYTFATPVLNLDYYLRSYVLFTTLPSVAGSNINLINFDVTSLSLTCDSAGNANLWNNGTSSMQASGVFTFSTGVWYRIEARWKVVTGGGANSIFELRINGTTVYSSPTVNMGTTALTQISLGVAFASVAMNVDVSLDDCAINDGNGTAQNTWPGAGEVRVLVPTADSAIGSGWLAGGGGTTGLWQAVDNEPPAGATTPTNTSQIKNATATAVANYDATLQSYTAAGIGASDTITLVQQLHCIANNSTTADSYNVSLVSNPAIGEYASPPTTNTVAGAFPTGWKLDTGNAISYAPTVTLGTAPVIRIGKRTSNSALTLYSCFMGLVVESVPPTTISSGTVNVGSGPDGLALIVPTDITLQGGAGGLQITASLALAAALLGGAGDLDYGLLLGGDGGLDYGLLLGGGPGGLPTILSIALAAATLGTALPDGLSVASVALGACSLGGSGGIATTPSRASGGATVGNLGSGLLSSAVTITPIPMGGAGGLQVSGGIFIRIRSVHMGARDVPGGGLSFAPLSVSVSYPNGHWVYLTAWIWRETTPGSGIFGWKPCPIALWRGPGTGWKQLTT